MLECPFLTAAWRNLVLLNFAVPADIIRQLAPRDTEPDLHDRQAYISLVAFSFERVRLCGIPVLGHTSFPEINLRYYVRREVGGEVRRGVVFVREIVPRRAVALLANRLYNENYVARAMRVGKQIAGDELAPGDKLEYAWQLSSRWNRIVARVASPLALPAAGSLEEFIVEHYWGYSHGRHGGTHEYQVAHVPWRVAAADKITWDCDVVANYESPLGEYLAMQPTTAIIAEGSPIQVFRGTRC